MKKQKKFLAVLSAAAISSMIAAAVSTTAFAKTTDVVAKIDGQEVKINFEELTTAYENKAAGLDSELFNKYDEREGLTALLDDKNGFVDYKAVQEAAEDAVALEKEFDLNNFTETTEKTLADFKPEAEWKDDKAVPVTPVEEELKVESVSAIEDINIEFAGEYTLPAEVEVTLSDATVVSVPVVWDETNIDVNVAGTYAVEGTLDLSALENVEATELKATVNVVVAEEVVEQLKVESVSAINGTLTVTLSDKLTATPISADFKVVQNINGTTRAIAPSSVAYDEATKTVKLTVPQISATEVDQTVSYIVGYKETPVVSSNSFTIAKVGELKATSATQISSTQIKVTFNQKVTKATAETLANYTIGKAGADGKISSAYAAFADTAVGTGTTVKLQADEQSVIITLGTAEVATANMGVAGQFDNNTAYLLNVATTVLPQAGKAAEKAAELPFTLNDAAKPVVEKFAIAESGDLVVSFNEKLNATPVKVVINGQALTVVPVYDAKTGKSTATFTKANLTDAKPAGFGLEAGKSYAVSVAEAEDAYGKAMNIHTTNFTYVAAADAPKVEKVEAKGETKVVVTFSEPVYKLGAGTVALDATSFNITKGAKHFSAATVVAKSDNKVYEIDFANADLANDFIFDSYKNETSVALDVHVTDIKDAVGNITHASSQTVTVVKDTVKPEVTSKVNKANAVIDLTFNKELAPAAAVIPKTNEMTTTTIANKAYVLTSTGLKLPLAAGDINITDTTPNGKITFTLTTVNGVAIADGNYTLVLEQGAIVDNALNGGNKNNEIRIPFTKAVDGLVNKPELVAVNPVVADGTTPGNVVLTFKEQISYESAAKASNYKFDGTTIPAASEFSLDSTGKVLTIKLPEGTYKETGSKVISVSGVRNLAGTVMDEYSAVVTVKENEEINLLNGKVVNGDIILTFNENVNTATIAGGTAIATGDFIVKVNGVAVAGSVVAEADAVKDLTKVAKNQIRLTAPAGTSFLTGTITVEVKEGALAKDAAGNGIKVTGTPITITR